MSNNSNSQTTNTQGGQQSGQNTNQGNSGSQTQWPKPHSTTGPSEQRGNNNDYQTKIVPKK